jgi:hypothetical protein
LLSRSVPCVQRFPSTGVCGIQKWGIKNVELAGTYGLQPDAFNALLKQRGFKAIASHFPYEQYKTDPESIAREAKALKLKYAGCAWIPHTGDYNEATCREAIDVFNKAGSWPNTASRM